MSEQINIVFLAAGKGTRLKVDIAKPLITALGKSLVDYVVDEVCAFVDDSGMKANFGFVVGHDKEKVEEHLLKRYSFVNPLFVWQKEQLGTGHALQCFFSENSDAYKNTFTLVVCADTPLIKKEVYHELFKNLKDGNCEAVAATFRADNPFGYGRIERTGNAGGFNIVEEKDANTEQQKINEVNSGLYIFKTAHIEKHINLLTSANKNNEFYLTDLFKSKYQVKPVLFEDGEQFMGVNDLSQLEDAESVLLTRKLRNLQLSGVRLMRSNSLYIDADVSIAPGAIIHPNVSLYGEVSIGANVIIEDGCVIQNSTLADNVVIKAHSYLESCHVESGSQIGPMARLREGSHIGPDCKIGNFVETKKVELHRGAKVSHLSYVGDAEIGENTNIGCGFITCNYDGAQKHKTTIGKDCFIGSDCQMIAPINIGDEVFIGSGSTINQDVPSKAFAIARQRQVTKENMSHKFIKKKS